MAANNAEVSSEALSGLQTDLTQLSNSLHEIFDLMNADMSQVGEAWRDGKYEEFVNGYRPQINKCEEISVRYHDWCTRILSPAIERVVEVEQSNVGGDGSGAPVSNGSVAGAGAAGAAGVAAASNAKPSKVSGFNTSGRTATSQQSSSEVTNKIDAFLSKPKTPRPLSKADQECIAEYGSGYRGFPAKHSDAHIVTDSNNSSTINDPKVSAGLEVGVGKLKGHLGGEMGGGNDSSSKTTKAGIVCEPE